MMDHTAFYVALPIIILLVYVLILGRGVADPGWRVRCTMCGKSRAAHESGVSLIATLKLFSYTFDWCPGCADIHIHKVERGASAE